MNMLWKAYIDMFRQPLCNIVCQLRSTTSVLQLTKVHQTLNRVVFEFLEWQELPRISIAPGRTGRLQSCTIMSSRNPSTMLAESLADFSKAAYQAVSAI